ncbi:MAG: hypothetical protein CL661_01610 [Bacteroidetes bacterium]|nr:hypothetical protein [Bacteroidota bacterium]|tara:strand:+ start:288 stop:749 length:462 start_codon:yes stop_codon:yes gene_type:complete
MKKVIVLITAFLISGACFTQVTDLVILNTLMGTDAKHINDSLNKLNLTYYLTDVSGKDQTYYINNGTGGIKMWVISIAYLETSAAPRSKEKLKISEPLVYKIYIRYKNPNAQHLDDFFKYEQPPNKQYIIYDKQLGHKLSHFSAEMETFRPRK